MLASGGVCQHSGVMGVIANLLIPSIQRYGSLAQQPTVAASAGGTLVVGGLASARLLLTKLTD